ncbi:MAG: O-antigen ligase family protein [Actinomycetota bacterium]
MTLAIDPPSSGQPGAVAAPSVDVRQATTVAQPDIFERMLVVLTAFLFIHRTPDVWFRSRAELLADGSNPLLVVLMLGLSAIAFARIAGSIDYLINMFRLEPFLYLFVALTIGSFFWSASPIDTAKQGLIFVAVTLFGSYLVMRFALEETIKLLAFMFMISAIVNLAFVVALPGLGVDPGGNWTGVFAQKNALGFISALSVQGLFIAGLANRNWRWIFWSFALLHLGLLWFSQSKTMLVAGVGPICMMAVYQAFRSRRTLRGAAMTAMAGASVFTVAFATANIALLAQWLDKDVSLTGRVPMWGALIPVAEQRPLFGHGYAATFGGFFSPIHEVWIVAGWQPAHAHNALLQIWLEIGVFGVLLFLLFYFRAVSRAISILGIVPGAIGMWPLVFLTTALLVSITEAGMQVNPLGWMMMVVAVLTVSMHLKYRSELGLSNDLKVVQAERRAEKITQQHAAIPDGRQFPDPSRFNV